MLRTSAPQSLDELLHAYSREMMPVVEKIRRAVNEGLLYDIRLFGALPSIATPEQAAINTQAIQRAADEASAAGGGTVRISAGQWYFDHGDRDQNVVCQIDGLANVLFQGAGVGVTHCHIIDGAESNMFNLTGDSQYITIRDMSIDGNRANQTLGVSGIRGDAFSGLWLENLYVHDIYHYGIAFEGHVQEFIFMNNIKIENVGGDGFDQKNKDNANLFQCAHNIEIRNFGLNYPAEVTQTGWDCRGAWQLSNFVIHFDQIDGSGMRIRNTGGSDVGFGGHRTHASNIEIYGAGKTSLCTGIEMVGRYVEFSNVYIRDCLFGTASIGLSAADSGSGSDENSEDSGFSGVTAENCGTGFITSPYADRQTYRGCKAISCETGFRIRTAHCAIIDPHVTGCTTAAINTDTAGSYLTVINPTIIGVGGATAPGIDFEAAHGTVLGGDISACNRGIIAGAANIKVIGVSSRSNVDCGIIAAVGGDNLTVTDCDLTNNGTRGLHTRAARTTLRGGSITGNGGAGFLTESTASDCVFDSAYLSGNAADFDDAGSNTTVKLRSTSGLSLDEAVAIGGTSANVDIGIVSGMRHVFLVEGAAEDSGGARYTFRNYVQTLRSGAGAPTVPSTQNIYIFGAGLTLVLAIAGNSLRVTITNATGVALRLDTRVWEIWRGKTTEYH